MSDLLTIGTNAVRNSQLALNVVSNNIANANTEGYVKQKLVNIENTPASIGRFSVGTGALAEGVRRAYDGLIEDTVRRSGSDLKAQETLADLSSRMVDAFGVEQASLNPAMADFFNKVDSLGADASSIVMRDQVIESARQVAGRFNALAGQIDSFNSETQDAMESKVSAINEFAEQLAYVNTKLRSKQDLDRQPADLLDTRDSLLRQIADLTDIFVTTAQNGSVTVDIGETATNKTLVSGGEHGTLRLSDTDGQLGVANFSLNFADRSMNLSRLTGGELGGLALFRDRVLTPASANLEELALAVTTEVNAIHASGMNLLGNAGGDLFSIQPQVSIDYSASRGAAGATVLSQSGTITSVQTIDLQFDGSRGQWFGVDSVGNKQYGYGDPQTLTVDGVRMELTGQALGGDQISIRLETDAAASMQVAIDDAREVAAASLFRVTAASSNLGSATANLNAISPEYVDETRLSEQLASNANRQNAASFLTTARAPQFVVPAGTEDLSMFMQQDDTLSAELQVFTRDGRHIFGQTLNDAQQDLMLDEVNGFMPGVTYSSQYLNDGFAELVVPLQDLSTSTGALTLNGIEISTGTPAPSMADLRDLINDKTGETDVVAEINDDNELVIKGAPGFESNAIAVGPAPNILMAQTKTVEPITYKDLEVRAGQVGSSQFRIEDDGTRSLIREASLLSGHVPATVNNDGDEITLVGAGAINLNGYALTELNLAAGEALTPETVQTWLNDNIEELALDLSATIENSVRIAPSEISELSSELTLNGVQISAEAPILSNSELVDAINQASADTGVIARQDFDGALIFSSDPQDPGQTIEIGPADGAAGAIAGSYQAQLKLTHVREDGDTTDAEVALTLGPNGGFTDLSAIGFRAELSVPGALQEDLIVFTTAPQASTVQLSADYIEAAANAQTLRENPVAVEFVDADRYQIVDQTSGTVLAERAFTAGDAISYQNVALNLLGTPAAGDVFLIDGNADATGNSDNILKLSELEELVTFANGTTFHESFAGLVNRMGSSSRQAELSKDALAVVHDQAVESREGIAGVNLDEEASNLVKFQQAYQASAKLIQTANTIFDSIIRI